MKSMFAKVAHPNIAVGKSKNYFTHLEFLTVVVVRLFYEAAPE